MSNFDRAIITINTVTNLRRVLNDFKHFPERSNPLLDYSEIKTMRVTRLLLKPFLRDFHVSKGKESFVLSDQGRTKLFDLASPYWEYLKHYDAKICSEKIKFKQELFCCDAADAEVYKDVPIPVRNTIYNANNAIIEDPLHMDLNSADCVIEIIEMLNRLALKSTPTEELGVPFACDGSPAYRFLALKEKHPFVYDNLLLCPGGLHTILEATKKLGEVRTLLLDFFIVRLLKTYTI